MVLVLAGLPSASVRGIALVHDWTLGALEGRSVVLVEARKSLARLPEHDDLRGAAAGARPGEASDAAALHPAPERTTRSCRPILFPAAAPAPHTASLLPDCTGPPRA